MPRVPGRFRARLPIPPLAAALLLPAGLAACGGGSGVHAGARTGPASTVAGKTSSQSLSSAGSGSGSAASSGTGAQGSGGASAATDTATGVEDPAQQTPWLAPVANGPFVANGSVPPQGDCTALYDPGWQGTCARAANGGDKLYGVVEHRSTGGATYWKAAVWTVEGVVRQTLAAGSGTEADWSWAGVVAADVQGTPGAQGGAGPRLVFGFENNGTGHILDLDVVEPGGHGLLGGQITVYMGTAKVETGRILTYHPVYRADDPNCCPSGGYARDTVEWRDGQWHVTSTTPIPAPGPGGLPNDFPDPLGNP